MTASAWTETEIVSALGVKERNNKIDEAGRKRAMRVLRSMLSDSFNMLEINEEDFRFASDLMERNVAPLKAPDALHLAIVARSGAVLWTTDGPMFRAAEAHGISARLLA